MAVLSASPRLGWRDPGRLILTALARLLYSAGWLVAKALRTIATALGALLFAAGWLAAAVAWPSLCWCGRAVRLGWQEGRKPIGRGTAG
jgi:hypothetical protein